MKHLFIWSIFFAISTAKAIGPSGPDNFGSSYSGGNSSSVSGKWSCRAFCAETSYDFVTLGYSVYKVTAKGKSRPNAFKNLESTCRKIDSEYFPHYYDPSTVCYRLPCSGYQRADEYDNDYINAHCWFSSSSSGSDNIQRYEVK